MSSRSVTLFVSLGLLASSACTSSAESPSAGGETGGLPTGGSAGSAAGGTSTAGGGASGGGTGGASGSGNTSGQGGAGSGMAGSSGNGNVAGASGASDGGGGAPSAGSAGLGGSGLGGAGGRGATGGAAGSVGGFAGQGGTGGAMPFVCNQVTAMTLTREWFQAGFQQNSGILDGRWQLKAREHGYITEWSNPSSDFWNEPIESPCTSGSTSPDHVVLTVLSWAPACCDTQPEWEAQVTSAVTTLRSKYTGLRRIDLMTVVRGPGNMLCPTPPAAGESIVIPPELDAALAAVAAAFPNLVFVAPKFEATNCSAFSGGGPHLTSAGNSAVARTIGAHFATFQ